MNLTDVDWGAVGAMSGAALKSNVFEVLQAASAAIQEDPSDNPLLLGVIPRLADLIESRNELSSFREAYSALARSVGLWNYIDRNTADLRDQLVAEAATVPRLGVALHREQVAALNSLLSGHNLILSAPTSFGKSLLVDALLLSGRFRRVAILLPTIALLDEFRRRLVARFGAEFDVLMHHSERPVRHSVIFLGTQERLINRDDLGFLDLVVVDEFYKLDPSRHDERSLTLNAAVYRLISRSKQFFFLGPNVDNVSLSSDSRWRFEFLRTRFSTVAVDTYHLNKVADKQQRLAAESYDERNWPALIFVSSPDRANKLAKVLVDNNPSVGDGNALAQWMADNYGKGWSVTDAVAAGVGVHHGRVPRALASRLIQLFNTKKIPILICTSTLIEGVNTAAKSVLIYDKKIARADYDFFTFANIRGRAGRLGQHRVGNKYLFHAPPGDVGVEVKAPLFGHLDDAPDEFVVHIEEQDSTPLIGERVLDIAERAGLTPEELRRFSSLGIERLETLRSLIAGRINTGALLQWTGRPGFDEIVAVSEVISHLVARMGDLGVYSFKQLGLYLNKLRSAQTMREFFHWHADSFTGEPENMDGVFKFLRAAEYSLPEYFAVIDLMVRKAGGRSNYDLFIAEMPRWFRADALKMLEEQGVPIQISERFLVRDDTAATLGGRLRSLADANDERLSLTEVQWIVDALPRADTLE